MKNMETYDIFWDRKIDQKKIARILKNQSDPQFIETAALMLSRTNKPREVFERYLDKIIFCRNWHRIKRRMRLNKWADTKIIFWDEVYKVLSKKIGRPAVPHAQARALHIDPEMKVLADSAREARKEQGFTQAELGKKAKISQQTISFFEKGYINISLKNLKKIADALGMAVALVNKK
ncbi:MAG: helix-turn-helix transcriptional regulator [Candidatus Omnitrophica bacterium]|nr:helix-turn-helix transcriptional regulator [Candidatus Omnitrophota bacterium]